MARILGPSELGHYSNALAIVAILGLPIHMGLPTLVVRETAKSGAECNWGKIRGLWNWALSRIGVVSVLWATLVIPFLYVGGERWIGDKGIDAVWAGLLLIPLMALAHVRGASIRGLHQAVLGLLPDAIVRPGLLLILLLFALYVTRVDAVMAVGFHVVAAAVATIFGTIALRKVAPIAMRGVSADLSEKTTWKKSLLPLALLTGAQVMMQNTNTVILGLTEPPEQVGIFKIALAAAELAAFGLTVVNMTITPTFAKLHTKGDLKELESAACQAARLAFFMAILITAAFVIFGQSIISATYGKQYLEAYYPLIVILIGQVVHAYYGSCGNILTMTGNEKITLFLAISAMLINVSISAILVPSAGIIGAAIATAISMSALHVSASIAVYMKLGIRTSALGPLLNHSKTDQS
jgi:O-antigen/teichoic acid export membrane protein